MSGPLVFPVSTPRCWEHGFNIFFILALCPYLNISISGAVWVGYRAMSEVGQTLVGYLSRHFPILDTGLGAAGWEQPQPCSSSLFRECHFSYSSEVWSQSGTTGPKASSRRWICGPSFPLDNLWLKRPDTYGPGLLRAGPPLGKSGVHLIIWCPYLLNALRRSFCQPCGVSGRSGFPQALLSVSAWKLSGTGRLATSSEVFRASKYVFRPSPVGPPLQGTELAALSIPGQSRETGSLSRSPGGVGAPANSVPGSCLAALVLPV